MFHRPLGCFLVNLSSFWFKVVSSELGPLWLERGVVDQWFRPLRMVQSSSHFMYRFPRASTLKFRWSFGGGLSQFCAEMLESRRYESAFFDMRRASGVDRGVVNWLFLCFYQSDVVLLWWRSSQEVVLRRSGHVWVLNCVSFCQEMFKVGRVIIGGFSYVSPSEVIFSSFQLSFWLRIGPSEVIFVFPDVFSVV